MKINKEEYLLHIQDEKEKIQMKRVLDLIEITINRHTISYTDFLEPNLIRLAESILNRFREIGYHIDGGFENAERKIISIYSWYYFYEKNSDSKVVGLEIKGNINNIEHRDVLGSLLGLGLVRDIIGDIGFFENSIKVAINKDISNFIIYNLNKVKRENVKVKLIPGEDLGQIIVDGDEKFIIAPSMRLDSIISEALNLSRSDAQKYISSNLVKVNYSYETKAHKDLKIGDLISVRGKGRFHIKSSEGLTKKERIKLVLFFPK